MFVFVFFKIKDKFERHSKLENGQNTLPLYAIPLTMTEHFSCRRWTTGRMGQSIGQSTLELMHTHEAKKNLFFMDCVAYWASNSCWSQLVKSSMHWSQLVKSSMHWSQLVKSSMPWSVCVEWLRLSSQQNHLSIGRSLVWIPCFGFNIVNLSHWFVVLVFEKTKEIMMTIF